MTWKWYGSLSESYCRIVSLRKSSPDEIRFVIYVAFNLYLRLVTRFSNVCVMGLKVKRTLLAKGRNEIVFTLLHNTSLYLRRRGEKSN